MNSKDWKIGLLALAAVSLLSACGDDKETAPSSPFAGIWVLQDNLKEYSTYRGELRASNRRRFCQGVYSRPDRYGDSQFRMRAILIQNTGEVFRYLPGNSVSAPGFREHNYVGAVNSQGHFIAGAIGPDGRILSNWSQDVYGQYDLPAQTNLLIQGNVLTVYSDNGILIYERYDKTIIDEYSGYVSHCLKQYREYHERRGVDPRNDGRRQQMPKDYDPELDQQQLPAPNDQQLPPEDEGQVERRPTPRYRN